MQEPKVTTVFIGFGQHAAEAAVLFLRRGRNPRSMRVITECPTESRRAQTVGLTVEGKASTEPLLSVRLVLIDQGDPAMAMAAVTQVREAMQVVRLVVVAASNLRDRFIEAGADEVICPASIAGRFMAETVLPRANARTVH